MFFSEEEPEEKARQKERARVEILKAKYGKPERIKSNDDNLEYDIVKLASQLQTCLKLLHQVPEEGDRPKAKRTMPVPSNIERTSDFISSAYDPCFSIGECQDKNKILRKQVVPKVKRSTLLHKLSNSDVISSSAVPHSTTITDDCLNKGKKGLSEKMLRKLVALKSKQPASSSNSSNIEPSIVVSKQFKSTSAGPIKFDNSTKGNRYCEQIHKKIKITSISGYLCNVKKLKKQSLL